MPPLTARSGRRCCCEAGVFNRTSSDTTSIGRVASSSFCSSSGSSSNSTRSRGDIRRQNSIETSFRTTRRDMSSTSSEDAIPVTVFINHKLMNSKPIERLKSIKFDRLRIECVSDEERYLLRKIREVKPPSDGGSRTAISSQNI